MPLFLKKQQADLLLGIWKQTETLEDLLAIIDNKDALIDKLNTFRSASRKREWLAVRVLLKTLQQGIEEEIFYYSSGKPYLQDGRFISISHTKGYVAVAISNTCDIGIDIEQYGERVMKVSSRFIRLDEKHTVEQASFRAPVFPHLSNTLYAMLLHWSAKESMYKIMQSVDFDFLQHFQIFPFELKKEGLFEGMEYGSSLQKHFQIHYLVHPDFVMTYIVDKCPSFCTK